MEGNRRYGKGVILCCDRLANASSEPLPDEGNTSIQVRLAHPPLVVAC